MPMAIGSLVRRTMPLAMTWCPMLGGRRSGAPRWLGDDYIMDQLPGGLFRGKRCGAA